MANVTIYANKEHSIGKTDASVEVGTSKEKHGPIGEGNSGWEWRELIKFPMSVSDFGGLTQITSAVIKFKTTGAVHATNDSVDILVKRLTSSFAATGGGANDASDSWRTGADPNWGGSPSTSVTGAGSKTWNPSDNTVYEIDITELVEFWLPASIKKSDGSDGNNGSNYGVMMRSVDETDNSSMEIQTIRNSYSPRIVVTGTTVPTPEPPDTFLITGQQTSIPASTGFGWDGDAGDESPLTAWDMKMSESSLFTDIGGGPALSNEEIVDITDAISGISGVDVASPTFSFDTALERGKTYYYNTRHENSEGENGDWSAIQTFTIPDVPDIPTLTNPTVAKPLCEIFNLDAAEIWTGSGDEAYPVLKWQYNHPEGLAMAGYMVEWDSTEYETILTENIPDGTTMEVRGPTKAPRNSAETYRVKAKDTNGNWGAYTASVSAIVQWAQGIFNYDHGAGAGAFDFAYAGVVGGEVAFQFREAEVPGVWKDTIGEVTTDEQVDILVRLATDDSTSNPTLPDMTLSYLGSGSLPPDQWELFGSNGTLVLDDSRRRFGRRSAKVTLGDDDWTFVAPTYGGTDPYIIVTPGEKYTYSIHILTSVALTDLKLKFLDDASNNLQEEDKVEGEDTGGEWVRITSTITVPDGITRLRPVVVFNVDDAGTVVWLDSAQLEEGEITTQWRPGGIGTAVSIDVGGVQIDASKGGVFRLNTSNGNVITLSTDTLKLDDGQLGLKYQGAWQAGTYIRDDLVKYSTDFYICTAVTTTGEPSISGDWLVFSGVGATGADGNVWFVQSTSPTALNTGDLWLDTDDGNVYSWSGSAWGTSDMDLTGPTGSTGSQGSQGDQGDQGIQGDTGSQGIQGDTGAQGIQGVQGDEGPAGAVDGWTTAAAAYDFVPTSSGRNVGSASLPIGELHANAKAIISGDLDVLPSSGATLRIDGTDFNITDDGVNDTDAVRVFSNSGHLYHQMGDGDQVFTRSKAGAIVHTIDNDGTVTLTGPLVTSSTVSSKSFIAPVQSDHTQRWYRIAQIELDGTNEASAGSVLIQASDLNNVEKPAGILVFNIRNAGSGVDPTSFIKLIPFNDATELDDVAFVVTNNVTTTDVSVYVMSDNSWTKWHFQPLITGDNDDPDASPVWEDATAGVTSLPAGTQLDVEWGGPRLPVINTYTGNSTWTLPTANIPRYLIIEVQGGGSGGGAPDTTGSGEHAAGGGGGGGGYSKKMIDPSDLSSDITIVIGAGGAGGTSGNPAGSGSVGVASTAAATGMTTVTGSAGTGGSKSNDTSGNTTASGGTGGAFSGGDSGRNGDDGGSGGVAAGGRIAGGFGGGTQFAGQREPGLGNGKTGYTYGGGGSAGTHSGSTSGTTGGAGAAGVVIITEYY